MGADNCHIQGKNGLFSGVKDQQRDISKDCDYTMYDMDEVKPSYSVCKWYTPWDDSLMHTQTNYANSEWVHPIEDTSALAGGLGCGNYLNKKIVIYWQKQTPVSTQKKMYQHHLQIRNTWEFAENSEYDRALFNTYVNIEK